ncbi:coronin-7-like [Arapaima gigas]
MLQAVCCTFLCCTSVVIIGLSSLSAALEQHPDQLYSFTWKQDGSLMATSCKDKKLRVFDPRAQLTPVQNAVSFQTNKESRILWVKDSDHILTTGFNQVREREVRLWDSRKLGSSLGSLSLGTSSGKGSICSP